MRRRLIEALTYPRLFVLREIGVKDCPHDSVFDPAWDRCRNCGLGQECHWLSCLNDFAELSNRPLHTLHASLLYSINLIEAHIEELQHDARYCDCEPCSWTRHAHDLSRSYTGRYAWDIRLMDDKDSSASQTNS
jgi:hypothetical protein